MNKSNKDSANIGLNSIVPYVLFLLICFPISKYAVSQDTLYWNAGRSLTWEDFKGPLDTTIDAAAITTSGIYLKFVYTDTSFIYSVGAFFDKRRSWKTAVVDNLMLAHEQVHFDITELFARKMKTELSGVKPERASVKKVISDIVQRINGEKERMQDKYDQETNFGLDAKVQEIWQVNIKALLKEDSNRCYCFILRDEIKFYSCFADDFSNTQTGSG